MRLPPGDGTSVRMFPFALGFQLVSRPELLSRAARFERVRSFTARNLPPTYRRSPNTRSENTPRSALGFHESSTAPVVAPMAARRLWALPPTLVKSPPA